MSSPDHVQGATATPSLGCTPVFACFDNNTALQATLIEMSLPERYPSASMNVLQEPQIADEELTLPKIRVGICAMDKKARSRPMNAIVDRMLAFGEFEIFTFSDECILTKPIQEWPTCECLLSWHSDGFPLAKVFKFNTTS